MSGIKGENSIKLYGNDLKQLTDTAQKIRSVLLNVHGVKDLAVFAALGQPTVQIDIDRDRAARYGLTPADINSTIKTAIGGPARAIGQRAPGRLTASELTPSGRSLKIHYTRSSPPGPGSRTGR